MSSVSTFLTNPFARPSDLFGKYAVVTGVTPPCSGFIVAHRYTPSLDEHFFRLAASKRPDDPGFGWAPATQLEFAPEPVEKAPAVEVEETVCAAIRARRDAGRKKYGTTMERGDLTPLQWLQHAQEEAMDFAIYLEKLRRVLAEQDLELQRLRKENAELRLLRDDPILHKAIAEGGGPG